MTQQQPRVFMPQEPFYGVARGVAQCQQERTEELSRRMRDRIVPSAPLQPQMCARPVLTKYAMMPILAHARHGCDDGGGYVHASNAVV